MHSANADRNHLGYACTTTSQPLLPASAQQTRLAGRLHVPRHSNMWLWCTLVWFWPEYQGSRLSRAVVGVCV